MDIEALKWVAQFGMGGVVAAVALLFYSRDRKASEERYAALAQEFRTIVRDNTAALTRLTDALDHERSARR